MCHRGNTFGVQMKLQVAVVIACLLLHASQASQVDSRKLLQAPGTIAYDLALLKAEYKRELDNLKNTKVAFDQRIERQYSIDLDRIIERPTSTKIELKIAKNNRQKILKINELEFKKFKRALKSQYKKDKKDIKKGITG